MLNSSALRKAAGKRRLLPSGYVGVDNIYFNGTQVFQTGLIFHTADTRIEFNYQNTTTITEVVVPLSQYGTAIWFIQRNYIWITETQITLFQGSEFNLRHKVIWENGSVYCDGEYKGKKENISNNSELFIGGYRGGSIYNFIGKIFSIKANKSGVDVMNYIPAMRLSDLAFGLYDTISGRFLSDADHPFDPTPLKLPSGLTQSGDPYMYQGHGCVDVIINWSGRNAIYDLVTRTITYYNE